MHSASKLLDEGLILRIHDEQRWRDRLTHYVSIKDLSHPERNYHVMSSCLKRRGELLREHREQR